VLKEVKSPLAQLFLRAERVRDPIYIHYSQPSIQVAWLLESTVDGSTWPRRFSSFEAEHNRHAKARNAWLKAFQDLGFSPQFISSEQLGRLRVPPEVSCTLVLPQSHAMSEGELASVAAVLEGPFPTTPPERLVLADGPPGLFNEHGRLRTTHQLERVFPADTGSEAVAWRGDVKPKQSFAAGTIRFPQLRLSAGPEPTLADWLEGEVGQGTIQLPTSARARVHRFRAGDATLVAIERNIEYQMSEDLKQAGGNEALEKPVELIARLSPPFPAKHVYDLRTGQRLGQGREWTFTLDPWQPSLFALVDAPATVGADLIEALLRRVR
jgi:hypothetical protein